MSALKGKTVVFTGTLATMKRAEASKRATAAGAKVGSAISGNTDIVVAAPGAGAKLEDAKALGVVVWSESQFQDALDGKPVTIDNDGEGEGEAEKEDEDIPANLQQWLSMHPRGSGRYRPTRRPAVLDLSEDEEKWESVLGIAAYAYEGSAQDLSEEAEGDDYSDYCFYRLSLRKLQKDFEEFRHPRPTLTYGEENGPVAEEGLQHGDIVLLHPYRGCGAFVCYGPSDDLALIKTGSEYGYCIPFEFCDAPEGFFTCMEGTLDERAWPSPSLLPPLDILPKADADELVAFKKLGGKKPSEDVTIFGCSFESEEKLPKFSLKGDDGFLIANPDAGVSMWLPSNRAVRRYVRECAITAAAVTTDAGDSVSFETAPPLKKSRKEGPADPVAPTTAPPSSAAPSAAFTLAGKTIAFIGPLSMNRSEAIRRCAASGAKVVGGVNAAVHIAVVGGGSGSSPAANAKALENAKTHGVMVVTEEVFAAALSPL